MKARNGEGSIRPRATRSGTVYDVQLTVKNRKTGLSDRIFKGGFKTEAAAIEWRNKEMAKSAAGGIVRESALTVPQLVDRWIKESGKRAPSTEMNYERTMRNHIRKRLNIRVKTLTVGRMQSFLDEVSVAASARGGNGRGAAEVAHAIVRGALSWAAMPAIGLVHSNPIQGWAFSFPEKSPQRMDLPQGELARLLAASEGQRSNLMWRLLVSTGLRKGEALGMNVMDVDLEARTLTINKIASPESHGRLTARRTKTSSSARVVPISPRLIPDLQKLIAGRGQLEPLFMGRGGRLTFTGIQHWWKRDCAKAGIVGWQTHCLRHTFATVALEQGMDVKVVSYILGHSDVATTLRIYSHATKARQVLAVDVVSDALAL